MKQRAGWGEKDNRNLYTHTQIQDSQDGLFLLLLYYYSRAAGLTLALRGASD